MSYPLVIIFWNFVKGGPFPFCIPLILMLYVHNFYLQPQLWPCLWISSDSFSLWIRTTLLLRHANWPSIFSFYFSSPWLSNLFLTDCMLCKFSQEITQLNAWYFLHDLVALLVTFGDPSVSHRLLLFVLDFI